MDDLIFKKQLTKKINLIIFQLLAFFILFALFGRTRSGVKNFFVYISLGLLVFAICLNTFNLSKFSKKANHIFFFISDFGSLFASVILTVQIIFFFILFPASVSQNSMRDTLFDGDFIIVSPNTKIKRFDIVVAEYDANLNGNINGLKNKEVIIKRLIGLPKDNIAFLDHKLFINGVEINEQYFLENKNCVTNFNWEEINGQTNDFSFDETDFKEELDYINGKYYIPEGCYFLMGDNRRFSIDSRVMGVFNSNQLRGVVFYKFENIFKIKKLR